LVPDRSSHEPRRRARRRALQALYQWHLNPCPVPDLLSQFRAAQDFSNVDEEWFQALVTGVTSMADELAQELAQFGDREFATLDVVEKVILEMGAWELQQAQALPVPVVINEAVDLARRFGAEQAHGYINAVLDRAARAWRSGEVGTDQPPAEKDGV
jgi:N utilization substance protein B